MCCEEKIVKTDLPEDGSNGYRNTSVNKYIYLYIYTYWYLCFWIANGKTKVIVYTLVQHYSHTNTIQLQYIATCFGGGRHRHRPNNTATGRCLSCNEHIAVFRVRLQQRAVYVTTPTYVCGVVRPEDDGDRYRNMSAYNLTVWVCSWCWTSLLTIT
jgi:hypothetical protein